jgi:hypothetical protein
VLLTAAFAVAGDVFDQECIHYQTETIKTVRERISLSESTATINTMGAILLLAGVEVW